VAFYLHVVRVDQAGQEDDENHQTRPVGGSDLAVADDQEEFAQRRIIKPAALQSREDGQQQRQENQQGVRLVAVRARRNRQASRPG